MWTKCVFFINDQNNFTKLPNQKTNFELRDVGVNIFSYEYCLEKTVYTSQYVNSDTDICAGVPDNDNDGMADGGKDSCQGNNSGQKKENILTRINNLNVQINNSDNIIFWDFSKWWKFQFWTLEIIYIPLGSRLLNSGLV
jgi:hypothetical protein